MLFLFHLMQEHLKKNKRELNAKEKKMQLFMTLSDWLKDYVENNKKNNINLLENSTF